MSTSFKAQNSITRCTLVFCILLYKIIRIFNLKFAHRLAEDDNYDDKRASLHVSLRTRKLEKKIQYCCRDSFFVEKDM